MDKARIFLIDNEPTITLMLGRLLSYEGYKVSTANGIKEAEPEILHGNFDLIITDINLGDGTGINILKKVKKKYPTCPVILITGYPNVETAAEAVRLDAYDYLSKPVKKETMMRIVKNALQHKALVEDNVKYRSNMEAIFRSVKEGIITVDKELRILELNVSAEDICGLPCGEITKGKTYQSFLNGCSSECYKALQETINTKLPTEKTRFECNKKNKPRQVVSVATYPLLDSQEKFNGCVMVVRDETRLTELENDLQKRQQFHEIIGKSQSMQKIYSFIDVLANTNTTVLLTGESGTGKGLVAEALHCHAKDSKRPFVVVNCSSLSDNLLESELFGHVKGAFTGAVSNRVGRFQMADGGTIFLDEVGTISSTMQLRLLRVIQDMEFERVGESTPVKVNVRVVAATNQDLLKNVKSRKFREDLYHRLKVVELKVPPLRKRREDIPLLVSHFIEVFNKQLNKSIKSVSSDVHKIFMEYKWPGNVRELQHTLEYAFVLCNKPIITVDNLPTELGNTCATDIQPCKEKRPNEREGVIHALKKAGWNKAKAARLLGIDRTTIYQKIKKYNINNEI